MNKHNQVAAHGTPDVGSAIFSVLFALVLGNNLNTVDVV